jgi:hypothetical protein
MGYIPEIHAELRARFDHVIGTLVRPRGVTAFRTRASSPALATRTSKRSPCAYTRLSPASVISPGSS